MNGQDDLAQEHMLHDLAVRRLKKRRDFYTHLVVYLAVNGFLVLIWALTTQGFFWPAFVMGAWGIGLLANAWEVFGRQDISEERVRREMERLQHHR